MLLIIDFGYNYLIKAKVAQPALTFLNLNLEGEEGGGGGGGGGGDEDASGSGDGAAATAAGRPAGSTTPAPVSNPLRTAPM